MNSFPESCFIADDLSGALEVGSVFLTGEQPVRLATDLRAPTRPPTGGMLGYDLNTRQMTEARAHRTVRTLVTDLREQSVPLLYKKIDSTLRGWIGAETRAVLEADPGLIVLFCPANPAVGRTVREGRLLVDNQPVDQTPFSRDPAFPMTDARIATRFPDELQSLFSHCPLSTLRAPASEVRSWITRTGSSGSRLFSFDAVAEADLDAIVLAGRSLDRQVLYCGSGALAGAIRRLDGQSSSRPGAGVPPPDHSAGGGVCFLIGSAHPKTHGQLEALQRKRRVATVSFDPARPSSWSGAIEDCHSKQQSGPIAIVPRPPNGSAPGTAASIQAFFRRLAVPDGSQFLPDRLFVTGGETARTVIDASGIRCLDLIGSLEPGVAVATGECPSGTGKTARKISLVTKPGGFGLPDTLIHCYDYLTA